MLKLKQHSIFKKPLLNGLLIFLFSFIITQAFTYQKIQLLQKAEQNKVHQRVLKLKDNLQSVMSQSFAATQTLSFIVKNYGIPQNFDSIAQLLLNSNKNVDALELVNGQGVITHVHPIQYNNVLGYNILQDSLNNNGAATTIEQKDYFTAGPIHLKQGGIGFVSRRPLFYENEFTGFTAAVIRLSTIIRATQLDSLGNTHFSYQLAKIHPDQSEEVFYSSKKIAVEKAIKIPITTNQGEFKLYVISNQSEPYSTIYVFSILGLLFSVLCGLLVWFITSQPLKLKQLVQEKTLLLNESKEKYQTLIEQASDGIFVFNLSGEIIDVNVMGAEMFGYSKNEMIEKNIGDIISPDDLAKTPIQYSKITKAKPFISERKMLRKDGSVFYGEISSKVLPNNMAQGIIRDTTKRKELEKNVQNNLKFFSKAFNNSTIGMAIKDENKRFVDANAYFINLIGFTLEEIKGKTSSELGLVDIDKVISNNPSFAIYACIDKMEVDLTTKSGEVLHFLTSVEQFDYENKILSLYTFIDQTETKKTNQNLQQNEKQYRQLTERISDAFISLDKDWNLTYINAQAAKFANIDPSLILGKNLWDEFPYLANSEAFSVFNNAMETQTYAYFEQYHEQFDGWTANKLFPSPEGITIYFRDITKKKKADQENQKLIAIIENSPDFIGLTSLEGKSLYLNEAGRKLVGFSKEKDITSTSIPDFFPDEYRDLIINEHLPYLHKNGNWSMEVVFKNFETNKIVPAEFSSFLIHDKISNKPIGLGCIAIDLTKRKKTEHEIFNLKSKMDTAIRIAKIGYWDWNLETEIIDWSDRMYEIYDVDPGTIITAAFTKKLIHPDDWDYHNEILALKSAKKDTSAFTYRTVHRDNSIKYLLVEMEVVEDKNNNPIRYRGTVIDITEQKEAENEIINLQSKMNAAIRIGKFGYWNWEMEKDTIEWSEEMYAIHHINPNVTITPELVKDIIYPEDFNVIENKLDPIKKENQSVPSTYRILLKDKTLKHFLAFSEVIYDKNGKPIRYHGTAMDNTKNVLAEEALRESQEKFAKAFETSLMGMIIIDGDKKVIEANSTFSKMLGVERENLIGKSVLESGKVSLDQNYLNESKKVFDVYKKEGKIINQEFKATLNNGQKISFLISVESLFINNKENYLVSFIDDTKRKEAEEALEFQNIQLKKTNSELDSFVYSASHELRAPLASVLGLINISLMEENDPSLVENLAMMEKSIKRLDDFIKDIIEYSRNKHLKINKEKIKFTTLIENSIETFWYLENTRKLKINISVDDKVEFVSDLKRISILLNNFISNAIKYHDLNKDSPTIWINIKTTKKEAIIKIKDNGLGMEEEQLDKIFDMFYRISSQIMGSGIGLFIVKEVLTKLNGTIEVESVLGEGSTFTLKLPNESKRKSK